MIISPFMLGFLLVDYSAQTWLWVGLAFAFTLIWTLSNRVKKLEQQLRERDLGEQPVKPDTEITASRAASPDVFPAQPAVATNLQTESVHGTTTQAPDEPQQIADLPLPPPLPHYAQASSQPQVKAQVAKGPRDEISLIANWAPIVGGLFAIAAMVFFANHFFAEITPMLRFCLLLAGCGLLYGIGVFAGRHQFPQLGNVLRATGLAGLYLTIVAGYALPPVKVMSSIGVAIAMQLGALSLILFESLYRRQSFTATCTIVFGFVSVLLLFLERINVAVLPSILLFALLGIVLLRQRQWASPALASLIGSGLLYAAFCDFPMPVGKENILSIQIFLYPILYGVLTHFLLLNQASTPAVRICRIGSALVWIVLGGIMTYEYAFAYFDWFVWGNIGLLSIIAIHSHYKAESRHTGICVLLAAVLLAGWSISSFQGLTVSLLVCAIALVMWILQRQFPQSLSFKFGFYLLLATAAINLLNQAYHSNIVGHDFLNFERLVYLALWLGLVFLYQHTPSIRANDKWWGFLRVLYSIGLGITGVLTVRFLFNENQMYGLLVLLAGSWLLSWKASYQAKPLQMLLLLAGLVFIGFESNALSINLYLLTVWGIYFFSSPRNMVLGIIAVVATLLVFASEHYFQGAFAILLSLLLLGSLYRPFSSGQWCLVAILPWIVLYVDFVHYIDGSSGVTNLSVSPLSNSTLISFWGYLDRFLVPIVLLAIWWVNSRHVFKREPLDGNGTAFAWLTAGAGMLWLTLAIDVTPLFANAYLPSAIHMILLPVVLVLLTDGRLLSFSWLAVFSFALSLLLIESEYVYESPLILLLILGACLLIGKFNTQNPERNKRIMTVASFIGVFSLFNLVTTFSDSSWVSGLLAICCMALLILGLSANLRIWRIWGLLLFPVVVYWILVIDIEDNLTRILACAGLAVASMLTGFFYQKLRKSIKTDEPPPLPTTADSVTGHQNQG